MKEGTLCFKRKPDPQLFWLVSINSVVFNIYENQQNYQITGVAIKRDKE